VRILVAGAAFILTPTERTTPGAASELEEMATELGVIAGASMVLVDFHPEPKTALCDGPQALTLEQLPLLMQYIARVRKAYDEVVALAAPAGARES
jgi:3-deoxy-D-arabino-heptulosonate 7-phosphate (DAHP) synthase